MQLRSVTAGKQFDYKSLLLKKCMELGVPSTRVTDMFDSMRGKTDEEQQLIALDIIELLSDRREKHHV